MWGKMNETAILEALEALAERLSIDLRYAELEGKGGLCKYGGQYHLILSKSLPTKDRIDVLTQELARFPLDDLFVTPKIREMVEEQRDEKGDARLYGSA